MTPVLIDTDPGVDDALALFYAFGQGDLEVVALTTVFGNIPVETASRNALWLSDRLGHGAVPVHTGAAGPLSGAEAPFARHVHGDEGFGSYDQMEAPRAAKETDAADAIIAASKAHAGKLVVIALGPLTNLAVALSRDPGLPGRLAGVVVMGGAFSAPGNVSPHAEANIHNDPEAARQVAEGFPGVLFVGLDVTDRIALRESDCAELAEAAPTLAEFTRGATDFYLDFYKSVKGIRQASLHDPAAIIALTRPELFTFETGAITVETVGEQAGMTRMGPGGTARFAAGADLDAVRDEFMEVATRLLKSL